MCAPAVVGHVVRDKRLLVTGDKRGRDQRLEMTGLRFTFVSFSSNSTIPCIHDRMYHMVAPYSLPLPIRSAESYTNTSTVESLELIPLDGEIAEQAYSITVLPDSTFLQSNCNSVGEKNNIG